MRLPLHVPPLRRGAVHSVKLAQKCPRHAAALSTTADPARPQSTINQDEIAFFSRLSALWWDEQGEFGMLHRMNPVRMQFIREKLVSAGCRALYGRVGLTEDELMEARQRWHLKTM